MTSYTAQVEETKGADEEGQDWEEKSVGKKEGTAASVGTDLPGEP